jgi:predicted DNA-binding protein (MmcQ/YjbR family)
VPPNASFKVSTENYGILSERDGFKPSPYLARHNWVFLEDIGTISKEEWKAYLTEAYKLVASKLSKKKQKELNIGFS